MKKITAVIPVRKGSQRVIGKNLKPFGDTSLLEFKIRNLKKVKLINEIIVNTDWDQAIDIARSLGVNYHDRDPYYASSEVTASDLFEHLGKVTNTDYFAYCPSTSPFVSIETMENAIKIFLESKSFDSVTTVTKVKEFLWLDGKPINYEPSNCPNSQDLPNIQSLNYGFTIVDREVLVKKRSIIGETPFFLETKGIETVDIDTPLDFLIAEQIYSLYLQGIVKI